jgi:hypothetical protein
MLARWVLFFLEVARALVVKFLDLSREPQESGKAWFSPSPRTGLTALDLYGIAEAMPGYETGVFPKPGEGRPMRSARISSIHTEFS